ncbi:MAG: hypothetical protein LIO46_01835 [Clostridiales bacterium]|nr:hypothetical protein [Clostridiales bacterium]
MKQVYKRIAHSHPDVDFYCACLKHKENGQLVQQPKKYLFKILKINLLCRLPGARHNPLRQSVGTSHLSGTLRRTPVYDQGRQLIQHDYLVADLLGCAFLPLKSTRRFYEQLEQQFSLPGFAKRRAAFRSLTPVQEIYARLEQQYGQPLDYHTELELAERNYIANPYFTRLLEIAEYNDIKLYAVIDSSYPASFFHHLLETHNIPLSSFTLTSESGVDKRRYLAYFDTKKGMLASTDFDLIRQGSRQKLTPLYYRDPVDIMRQVDCPDIGFREAYLSVCGLGLFTGKRSHTFPYEIAYTCLAPFLHGYLQEISRRQNIPGTAVLCIADEELPFLRLYRRFFGTLSHVPCSPFLYGTHPPASSGTAVLEQLRAPILSHETNANTPQLTPEAQKLLRQAAGGYSRIVLANPVPGSQAAASFRRALSAILPDIACTCFTLEDYLGLSKEDTAPLARIVLGNTPVLSRIQWFLYPCQATYA